MAGEDRPGEDLINSISGAITGKNIMDTARSAWKRISGGDSSDDNSPEKAAMIEKMNKESNDARVKRANDALIEQKAAESKKIPTQTMAQKKIAPSTKAQVTVTTKAGPRKKM